jgi:hypothetical protein
MFTYQTTDRKEARRFRIAQFNGRSATARCADGAITGRVRSIVEGGTGDRPAWVITIIPDEPKAAAQLTRPAPRIHLAAEDYL